MIKDKRVPFFIIIFTIFLFLFEKSISSIITLNQHNLLKEDNPILKFELVKNSGAAWGILQNSRIFLIAFGIIVIIFIFFYAIKMLSFKDKFEVLAITLFIGGTFGNTLERINTGYITDYIKIVLFEFPTFNIFDICIVCGIILFVILSLNKRRA